MGNIQAGNIGGWVNTGSFPRYSQDVSRKAGVIVSAAGAAMKRLNNGPMLQFCNPRFCSEAITFSWFGGHMFDVYLNQRRDLLVVSRGLPIPTQHKLGRWRKSKKKVLKVSDEIRSAVQRQGYYVRKLRDLATKTG